MFLWWQISFSDLNQNEGYTSKLSIESYCIMIGGNEKEILALRVDRMNVQQRKEILSDCN
jgi:hypothetical protein